MDLAFATPQLAQVSSVPSATSDFGFRSQVSSIGEIRFIRGSSPKSHPLLQSVLPSTINQKEKGRPEGRPVKTKPYLV
jgi:hypothetical protein